MGQRYKGLFCGTITRNVGWVAGKLKGKGQEPRMSSEFQKLRDNRALRGTAGQWTNLRDSPQNVGCLATMRVIAS